MLCSQSVWVVQGDPTVGTYMILFCFCLMHYIGNVLFYTLFIAF